MDEATAEAAAKVNAKNEEQSSLRHKSAELKEQNNEIKEKLVRYTAEVCADVRFALALTRSDFSFSVFFLFSLKERV